MREMEGGSMAMKSSNRINLPRDAEGREIPLGTRKIFDEEGNEWRVVHVEYNPHDHGWRFLVSKEGSRGFFYARYVYLEKPAPSDSFEKLLDDMDRAIHAPDPDTYASITCGYFDSANMDCAECERKHDICRETCNDSALVDIAARIHKLSGEDDA